jgi:hypothetical protein
MSRAVMVAHNENVECYTPEHIFKALGTRFDLDPCAAPGGSPADRYTRQQYRLDLGQDGLALPWHGLVWLNPPWTRGQKALWVEKLKAHGDGIALVRTGFDSAWLHNARPDGIFWTSGRVTYLKPPGVVEPVRKGGAKGGFEPSMLLAYGKKAEIILATQTGIPGFYVSVVRHVPGKLTHRSHLD